MRFSRLSHDLCSLIAHRRSLWLIRSCWSSRNTRANPAHSDSDTQTERNKRSKGKQDKLCWQQADRNDCGSADESLSTKRLRRWAGSGWGHEPESTPTSDGLLHRTWDKNRTSTKQSGGRPAEKINELTHCWPKGLIRKVLCRFFIQSDRTPIN